MMPQAADRVPLLMLAVDRDSSAPMHRQVFDQIRGAILDGRLAPGHRLPSTRALANELEVSRNTVLAAYDQLLAEGYTEGQTGSGTRVSNVLPEDVLAARTQALQGADMPTSGWLSRSGARLAALQAPAGRVPGRSRAFRPGLPEIDRFPWNHWSRIVAKFWRGPPRHLVSYGEIGGYMPLRVAIAEYLRSVRGLKCVAEQVIVTAGAQQAIDLAARALLDPSDRVWIEDPGYAGIKGVLTAAGAELVPVPVDDAGIDVAAGRVRAPEARMAVVTPSHQYPLGSVMSLPRRLELLEWASESNAWILEDDYDSEYRYAGRPLSALQGMDASGRVIYVGTFSKVLFPAIRLGYMVVPPGLQDAMLQVRRALDDQTAIAMQPVLADFIESGHFAAHVRRMRTLYHERQGILIKAIERRLKGILTVSPDEAGMHLVAEVDPACGLSDGDVSKIAADLGYTVLPLSAFYMGKPLRAGVLLGYAGLEERDINAGIDKLADALTA